MKPAVEEVDFSLTLFCVQTVPVLTRVLRSKPVTDQAARGEKREHEEHESCMQTTAVL